MKAGRGIASPFVEVEFAGCYYDNNNKYKTNPACTLLLMFMWLLGLMAH